jgi:hypothetical protein
MVCTLQRLCLPKVHAVVILELDTLYAKGVVWDLVFTTLLFDTSILQVRCVLYFHVPFKSRLLLFLKKFGCIESKILRNK